MDSRTNTQPAEYKIIGGTFHIHTDTTHTCDLTTDGNKIFHYKSGASLGEGDCGAVYAMTSADSSAPLIAVKRFFPPRTYLTPDTKENITREINAYFGRAKHEAEYNKIINGLGVYFEFNAKATIPQAFIVMKREKGTPLSQYKIQSASQYLDFCIAAIQSLQKIHAKSIVHADIHNGNILVDESPQSDSKDSSNTPNIAVNYVDMTFSGEDGTDLSTHTLNLEIKPPEFKNQPIIKRNKKHDIYCLGLLFKEKYNKNYFFNSLQQQVEKLFNWMHAAKLEDRPSSDEVLIQLKKIQTDLNSTLIEWYKLQLDNENFECKEASIVNAFKKYINNDVDKLLQVLSKDKNLSKENCLAILKHLETSDPGYITMLLLDKDINKYVDLWSDDKKLQNEVMQLLFQSKINLLIKSPQLDTILNQWFYCKQVLFRLENNINNAIKESIVSYKNVQTSIELGRGANRYLDAVIKTADKLVCCLQELSPIHQLHLFTQSKPETLRKLVNENNLLDVLNILNTLNALDATTSHSKTFIEKLGKEHIAGIAAKLVFTEHFKSDVTQFLAFKAKLENAFDKEQTNSITQAIINQPDFNDPEKLKNLVSPLPSDKRNDIIQLIVKNRVNACKTFKDAVISFDKFNQDNDGDLYKDILLALNAVYQENRGANQAKYHHWYQFFGYSKNEKLAASRILTKEMTQANWKQYKGALNQGDLGEIGQRFEKFVNRP